SPGIWPALLSPKMPVRGRPGRAAAWSSASNPWTFFCLSSRVNDLRFFSFLHIENGPALPRRPVPRVEELPSEVKSCTAQGDLEGAKPASNPIECPAKPCRARRAAHEVGTFPLLRSGKVTAFLGCEKV